MRCSSRPFSRPTAMAAALLGGAAIVLVGLPTRGQQPTSNPGTEPTIRLTAPATAAPGKTRVDYELDLPAGFELRDFPAVRVVDLQGKLVELRPMYITQRTPTWAGFQRLWTKTYPPGVYKVSLEAEILRPDGSTGRVTTPTATLTVPEPPAPPTPDQ
jgi:hypothetical protein